MRTVPSQLDPDFLESLLMETVTDLQGRVAILDNEIAVKTADISGLQTRRGELNTKMLKAHSELSLLLATKK